MIYNYIKIAFRRLRGSKLYAFVNLTGLTVGITSCLLISLFIINEVSYDRFNDKADRIARVTMFYGDGGSQRAAVTGTKVGPQLQRTFPQVESFVRLINTSKIVKHDDVVFDEKRFVYADSAFFKIFSFRLLQGSRDNVLNAPNKVVVSASTAKKYFGNTDPVGKTLHIGVDKDYEVTGVVADAPENSQIKFDFIASFTSLDVSKGEEWWSANYITYLLLKDGKQITNLEKQIDVYMRTKAERSKFNNSVPGFHLEPLLSVHLHSTLDGLEPNGSLSTIYILGIIALLILVIACINYTNLATVQSTSRSAEIGIRKVLGAQRSQLFGQFIGESFLLVAVSLVFAIALAVVLLPYFNQLTGKSLAMSALIQPLPVGGLVALCLLIGLASGSYPALVLSNGKLITVLKSGLRLTSSGGYFRKSLIVFQFMVSVALIIATIIILQQLSFIRNKDLGYDKEHVIVLPVDQQMRKNYDDVKAAIGQIPGITSVSGANASPTFVQWSDGINANNGVSQVNIPIKALPSDIGFIKTMNMKIIAGTDFTPADLLLADTTNQYKNFQYSFILNETAVKALGWTPEQAIGKRIEKGAPGTIKAVIRDFHFSSLHEPVGPLMLFLDKEYTNNFFVKVSGQNLQTVINSLQQIWKERAPYRPFEYHFLDDDYNHLYVTEQKTAQVFSTFATLAILLACMGLFGLAAYTTVQRTKEIGIRKVLGASVSTIVGLIAKDFLILTFIAVVIASPIAWYFMNNWLQSFAYRINIHWWVFIIAGVSALLIAFITVSLQSIKAALANPVKSLKNE